MTRFLTILAAAFIIPVMASAQTVIDVTSNITGTVEWTNDNIYRLVGIIYVDAGATLNIQAGTTIWGSPGQGPNSSALVVQRNGTINAIGTAEQPIIFTMDGDDTNDPDDIPKTFRGQWGGVIILGNGSVNNAEGTRFIEGIAENPRTEYGNVNPNNAESSGTLRYVSIRHAGTDLGDNDEINGLTLGAVGSGTTLEFIEVYSNFDDGVEWFGGEATLKYCVVAFCGDDSFDYDNGWSGKGQFWVTLMLDELEVGNRGGEHDGGTDPLDGQPFSIPQIYNSTYIGSGNGGANTDNDLAVYFRENAGGKYHNCIFTDFNGQAIRIATEGEGQSSWQRFLDRDLDVTNNIFWNFANGSTWNDILRTDEENKAAMVARFESDPNWIEDPMLTNITRDFNGSFDPRPRNGSPALDANRVKTPPNDGFFSSVDFIGAFGHWNWMDGWTAVSQYGLATDVAEELEHATDVAVKVFPNPANDIVQVHYNVTKPGFVELDIVDAMGTTMHVGKSQGAKFVGKYDTKLNVSSLPNGVYFVRVASPGGNAVTSFIVSR